MTSDLAKNRLSSAQPPRNSFLDPRSSPPTASRMDSMIPHGLVWEICCCILGPALGSLSCTFKLRNLYVRPCTHKTNGERETVKLLAPSLCSLRFYESGFLLSLHFFSLSGFPKSVAEGGGKKAMQHFLECNSTPFASEV